MDSWFVVGASFAGAVAIFLLSGPLYNRQIWHYSQFSPVLQLWWKLKTVELIFYTFIPITSIVGLWWGWAYSKELKFDDDVYDPSFFWSPYSRAYPPLAYNLVLVSLGEKSFQIITRLIFFNTSKEFTLTLPWSECIRLSVTFFFMFMAVYANWGVALVAGCLAFEVAVPLRIVTWMQLRAHYSMQKWFFRIISAALIIHLLTVPNALWLLFSSIFDRVHLWHHYDSYIVSLLLLGFTCFTFYCQIVQVIHTMIITSRQLKELQRLKGNLEDAVQHMEQEHVH